MKLPAIPEHTPHKSASAAFALLTILVVFKVHEALGITAEELLLVVTSGMTIAAGAFAWLRQPKPETETVPLRGEVGP